MTEITNPWAEDRLGYQAIGEAFTKLVKSIDDAKVISIEAGFGRGKTFFRTAWSEHLRQSGEIVIEIDVQQSDHSGDPVVTLLGALVSALPKEDKTKGQAAIESAKKLGSLSARSLTKLVLRAGADEVIDAATSAAIDKLDDFDTLDDVIKDLGDGMSKAAGQLIAAQMAAEKVRQKELPEQLHTLHSALIEGQETNRVIIIIDELDRCHPDYAIAVLETMKLIFNQSGFVFCLMVNANYLEKLAQHRFGVSTDDEKYLDKFVDLRLQLKPKDEQIKEAVIGFASDLPLAIPYGDADIFGVEPAAKLAGELAVHTKLSPRKVKRLLQKIEIALRCYSDRPLDAPLLVFLAFGDETNQEVPERFLPRSLLTPEVGEREVSSIMASGSNLSDKMNRLLSYTEKRCEELINLPPARYLVGAVHPSNVFRVYESLAPHYIPSHRDVLDAVAALTVPKAE